MKMNRGVVRFDYYNNGGKYKKDGLKNKRKSYWSKLRLEEAKKKEMKHKAEEQAQREWERQFDNLDCHNDHD